MAKIKQNNRNIIKQISNVIDKLAFNEISFLGFIFCLIAPLIFNFLNIHWIWKILMVTGSILSLLILILLFRDFRKRENKVKFLYYSIPLVILFILSMISYWNFNIYGMKNIIFAFFIIYILFSGIYNAIKSFSKKTFFSEQFIIVIISVVCLCFWIASINKTVNNIESSELYFKIAFGLIYLIAISMIVHRYVYSNRKNGVGQTVIEIIVFSSLIVFTIPYYIKWWGVIGDDFELFVSIYTAMLGGGITLIGVAWTINKNNEDRKNDRKIAVKPLIYPISPQSEYNYKQQIDLIFYNKEKAKEHTFVGVIKNTDNGILIIEKAIINDINYEMKFPVVLDKNIPGQVIIYDEAKLEIKSMYIIGKDVLGNVLKYKILVNQDKTNIEAIYEE